MCTIICVLNWRVVCVSKRENAIIATCIKPLNHLLLLPGDCHWHSTTANSSTSILKHKIIIKQANNQHTTSIFNLISPPASSGWAFEFQIGGRHPELKSCAARGAACERTFVRLSSILSVPAMRVSLCLQQCGCAFYVSRKGGDTPQA